MARLHLDRTESSPPFWSWEPRGTRHPAPPSPTTHTMGRVERWPDQSFRLSPPAGLSVVLPKHLTTSDYCPPSPGCRGLGAAAWGEKKTEVPPPAGRVVTSPYRQPVVGVAARHVIHAPLNPARALPPPPNQTPTSPASSPQLSPSLLSHRCQQSQLRPPFALAPPPTATPRAPELRSPLPERGVGAPLSHSVPKSKRSGCLGLGGAVAAATIFHSFLPPRTRRTLQVCVQRGRRETHGLPGAPSSHPAASSARQPCGASFLPWGPRVDRILEPLTPLLSAHARVTAFFFFFFLAVAAAPRSISLPSAPRHGSLLKVEAGGGRKEARVERGGAH